MNTDRINRIWGVSLMVIGLAALVLVGSGILGIGLPDWLARVLGAAELLALPVLVYSTVKMLRK